MPEHFLWDISGDGTICNMLFAANNYKFALFGQPLFHGYYTHHHMEDNYIAFGSLASGGSPPLYFDEVPTKPIAHAGRSSMEQVLILTVYIFGSVATYYWVLMPPLYSKYNRDADSTQKAYFDAYTWGYFFICFLIYHYVLGPAIGINTGSLLAVLTG